MIQSLAIKILVGVGVVFICFLLGYLKYENGQLRADLAYSKKTQAELVLLCEANKQTQDKVASALLITKEPATIESFKSVVDILFENQNLK